MRVNPCIKPVSEHVEYKALRTSDTEEEVVQAQSGRPHRNTSARTQRKIQAAGAVAARSPTSSASSSRATSRACNIL